MMMMMMMMMMMITVRSLIRAFDGVGATSSTGRRRRGGRVCVMDSCGMGIRGCGGGAAATCVAASVSTWNWNLEP